MLYDKSSLFLKWLTLTLSPFSNIPLFCLIATYFITTFKSVAFRLQVLHFTVFSSQNTNRSSLYFCKIFCVCLSLLVKGSSWILEFNCSTSWECDQNILNDKCCHYLGYRSLNLQQLTGAVARAAREVLISEFKG